MTARSARFSLVALLMLLGSAGCSDSPGPPTEPPITEPPVTTPPVTEPVGMKDFVSVVAGERANCALTAEGATFCWGTNGAGQIGNGSVSPSPLPPTPISGNVKFTQISGGHGHFCGLSSSGAAYCWGNGGPFAPTLRPTDLRFRSVAVGFSQTCAVTVDGAAVCWAFAPDSVPVSVPDPAEGRVSFVSIAHGGAHTCALTAEGTAYCWGAVENVGTPTTDQTCSFPRGVPFPTCTTVRPVPVAGGLKFRQLSAGLFATCGVTTDDLAYCWGERNPNVGPSAPPLGNDAVQVSLTPVPVSGGLRFRSVTVGRLHACGVATSGAAYCWGANAAGQLGTGEMGGSVRTPVPVTGGASFTGLSAGYVHGYFDQGHVCGVTTTGGVLCWGSNDLGQLAAGPGPNSAVPLALGR